MIDPYTPIKDMLKYFKDRNDFKKAEKKIVDSFRKSKDQKNWKYRSLKAIVKESGVPRERTEFVLKNSELFRQSVKEGQDDRWTLREFDS